MSNEEYSTLRRKIGTQENVAERLGIDVRTLQRREIGETRISTEAAIAISTLQKSPFRELVNAKLT